jgi:hypothetical protein
MKNAKSKSIRFIFASTLALTAPTLALFLCAGLSSLRAQPGNDNRAPELTGVATNILVPDGNKVSFHAFAVGVQIYVATPSTSDPTQFIWTFRAPEAVLFADEGGNGEIGIHYAGPTWESQSGSLVVGAVVPPRVTVDTNAIPWLQLRAVRTEGHGILEHTTYIQRVNTTGGLMPATPPTQPGQEARVPYTAEYFFYRETQ